MKTEISPSNKNLMDLSSKIYEEPQLLEIEQFSGSMNELNVQYPIECLRENRGSYRVSYLGEDRVAVLLFDSSGHKLLGNIYLIRKQKSDFDGLKNGQLLDEVKAIDPDGDYSFLYTGKNDSPKVSYHYTKDGYLITIEYDVSNAIVRINEELI